MYQKKGLKMKKLVRGTMHLSGFLAVAMILGHPLTAADLGAETPGKITSLKQLPTLPTQNILLSKAEDEPANIETKSNIERLQSELDDALKKIDELKSAGLSLSMPQPASLASKNDGNDPLRSAFPISKKMGMRLAQLHFERGSAHLSPASFRLAQEASEWIKTAPGRKIIIAGFADTIGASEKNKELSAARAQSVATALAELGIDPAIIETKPMGEGMGPEKIGDNVAEPLNRCAAIFLAQEEKPEL